MVDCVGVDSNRLIVCAWPSCRRSFSLCSRCDRGQRYCSVGCRLAARRRSQREAGARHQRSPEGRRDHADRQGARHPPRHGPRRARDRAHVSPSVANAPEHPRPLQELHPRHARPASNAAGVGHLRRDSDPRLRLLPKTHQLSLLRPFDQQPEGRFCQIQISRHLADRQPSLPDHRHSLRFELFRKAPSLPSHGVHPEDPFSSCQLSTKTG